MKRWGVKSNHPQTLRVYFTIYPFFFLFKNTTAEVFYKELLKTGLIVLISSFAGGTSGFWFFAVFLLFPVFNNNQTELMSDSIFKTMHLEDKTKELIGWSKCKWYWYENSNSKYICNKFIVDLFLKFNESHYKHGFHHNVLSIKWVKDVAL